MWMLTADHGGYVKYWQSNMNNVKMYQAHKDPVRGLRWDDLAAPSGHVVSCLTAVTVKDGRMLLSLTVLTAAGQASLLLPDSSVLCQELMHCVLSFLLCFLLPAMKSQIKIKLSHN